MVFLSGLGYVYPATWHEAKFNIFARMTGEYLSETFLALGNDNQKRGPLNIIGAGNLASPNMSALQPLLQQDSVEGLFWYTFGAGYSGWNGTIFDRKSKKPVIGGRISLWGNASSGTMLGVNPMIEYFKMQLKKGIINTNASDVNGYSLVPVNVWSHTVDDVVKVAKALEQTGNFEIITPTTLLDEVRTKCVR